MVSIPEKPNLKTRDSLFSFNNGPVQILNKKKKLGN